ALVRVHAEDINKALTPIEFRANVINNPAISTVYESIFMGPK
ncbi:Type cbb3 cytochrome oxidase biogenesis protein CcoG, partial [Methylophaga thiooxydans]